MTTLGKNAIFNFCRYVWARTIYSYSYCFCNAKLTFLALLEKQQIFKNLFLWNLFGKILTLMYHSRRNEVWNLSSKTLENLPLLLNLNFRFNGVGVRYLKRENIQYKQFLTIVTSIFSAGYISVLSEGLNPYIIVYYRLLNIDMEKFFVLHIRAECKLHLVILKVYGTLTTRKLRCLHIAFKLVTICRPRADQNGIINVSGMARTISPLIWNFLIPYYIPWLCHKSSLVSFSWLHLPSQPSVISLIHFKTPKENKTQFQIHKTYFLPYIHSQSLHNYKWKWKNVFSISWGSIMLNC